MKNLVFTAGLILLLIGQLVASSWSENAEVDNHLHELIKRAFKAPYRYRHGGNNEHHGHHGHHGHQGHQGHHGHNHAGHSRKSDHSRRYNARKGPANKERHY